MPYDKHTLCTELTRDEDRKRYLYRDSEGIQTIGVGWNIQDKGLPDEAIDLLLDIGIGEAEATLSALCPGWQEFSDRRQRALLNMAFNMGTGRLAEFKRMWAAIAAGDWAAAAAEAMDSKWAKQVGKRAERINAMLREG